MVSDVSKSSGDARLDDNLIIHGDNLHVLKSLLPLMGKMSAQEMLGLLRKGMG